MNHFCKSLIAPVLLILLPPLGVIAQEIRQTDKSEGGEINRRIAMVSDRIMFGNTPEMTPDFILADISLKPEFKRRFTDFSGDISGRYFNAFSSTPFDGNPVDIHRLMAEALSYQHKDGRFGNPDLVFDKEKLGGPQMALLWGNGRLLVGIMDYYKAYRKPEVLAAAKKLGDFLNGITDNCVSPEIAERFKDKSATGYICFTQLMEGLVMLWDETKEDKYLRTASRVYTLLPPKGKQHSHGYLNTLLGTLMLYDRTGIPVHLNFVKSRYDELVHSPDYLITGGVPEYFGSVGVSKDSRDEGCSESDFLMLSFHLWKTTQDMKYLENAEHCLINHLFANQFNTGDFGSKYLDPEIGFRVDKNSARCWWCCNFHALRALNETRQYIFTKKDKRIQFNLFFDGEYQDNGVHLKAVQAENHSNRFQITILKSAPDTRLAIRKPLWINGMSLKSNGKIVNTKVEGDYMVVDRAIQPNEKLELELEYKLRLFDKDKKEIGLPLQAKTRAAIFYGPYLLSVDADFQPFFDSEPNYTNCLELPTLLNFTPASAPTDSKVRDCYLKADHVHSDMFGKYPVILRPVGETARESPCNVRVWFDIR